VHHLCAQILARRQGSDFSYVSPLYDEPSAWQPEAWETIARHTWDVLRGTHSAADTDRERRYALGMATGDWQDGENDAIVADYFAMELAGRPFNKAEHNRTLQGLIGRGRGSIEYKHQNISAVLKKYSGADLRQYDIHVRGRDSARPPSSGSRTRGSLSRAVWTHGWPIGLRVGDRQIRSCRKYRFFEAAAS
jgi:hypothetical protein